MISFRDNNIANKSISDSGPRLAFAPPVSDTINAMVFAAAGSKRHAIPSGAAFVVFNSTIDFYPAFGAGAVAAAVPAADITDGSALALSPSSRRIPNGVTHISIAVASAGVVTMEFYGP